MDSTQQKLLAIELQKVESSQISAIGYDEATNTMAVQFPGRGADPGAVYHYLNVPPATWAEFQKAESKGKFFGANIRPHFAYEKQPGANGIVFGLPLAQEPKYTTGQRDGRICNRATGKPIPDDEPIVIFRAKDMHASAALAAYLEALTDPEHRAAFQKRIDEFDAFALEHPDRMAYPTA